MSKYIKSIEVRGSNSVLATVTTENNRCVGSELFFSLFTSNKGVERQCVKAHKWADERIKVCERQETKNESRSG